MTSRQSRYFSSSAIVAAALAIAALTGCGAGSSATPGVKLSVTPPTPHGPIPISNSPTPAPLLLTPPAGTIYLGAFVNPSQEPSPPPSLLAAFETRIGRRMALSVHYYGFYDSFPGPSEADDAANGRIPIDSWDCEPSNAEIASGRDDNAIRARADTIKAFGYPIFLRYMWEMNLPANQSFRHVCYDPKTDLANGTFSPQYFIAAWNRIRAIFANENVTNVVWVWNASGAKNPMPYYPGNAAVDWVGFDRYDDGNISVSGTYQQPYSWLAPLGKPILIGETGATEQIQTTFFGSVVPTLQSQFPLIQGYMYFDSMNLNFAGSYSWVINDSSMDAFKQMANDPYFSARQP